MVRPGETDWDQRGIFTGWYDVELNARGEQEAKAAGAVLKDANWKFDLAYTSLQSRGQQTLAIILKELEQENIPIEKTWRLNERHYGNITGMNKKEVSDKYSNDIIETWRGYDVIPPPIEPDNPHYNSIMEDPKYVGLLKKEQIPKSESLKLTIERTLPLWNETIVPKIKAGKKILIVGHGNSLRAFVKHLEQISDEDITTLEIPSGIPFVYDLDEKLKPVKPREFLGESFMVNYSMHALKDKDGKVQGYVTLTQIRVNAPK